MAEEDKEIVLPSGEAVPAEGGTHTERAIERVQEEQKFVPVIIKRDDTAFKHPDDVLQKAIEEGKQQVERSTLSLFLSAISAGLILGFAAMAVAFAITVLPQETGPGLKRLAMGSVYPLGFIICILSRTELFTEHTALAVYPFLEKLCKFTNLARLWVVVLLGNMVGTLLSAFLLYLAESIIQAKEGYLYVAHHLVEFNGGAIFISAMLAGWLMALGSWLTLNMGSSTAQIICIYIVTFLIGIGGLHHCVAGSAEVFTAFFMDGGVSYGEMAKFLGNAIIGNLFGGSVFVAILNYAHIRKTQAINWDKKLS